ncbi:MAG: DUF2924 domain-containing protein [Planctomycetes bacterium]|nr:DUF2924 domain-containing protein [Planctomycetota bacterium]
MNAIQSEITRLQSLPKAKLIDLYKIKFGKVPRITHREFLWKRIAWKIQEAKFGGLSRPAQETLGKLIAEIELPPAEDSRRVTGKLRGPHKPGMPSVGTIITKEWNGQRIHVEILDKGFAWNGETYRSLTAVAKAVTGTHWNGKLFFGLTKRSRS